MSPARRRRATAYVAAATTFVVAAIAVALLLDGTLEAVASIVVAGLLGTAAAMIHAGRFD